MAFKTCKQCDRKHGPRTLQCKCGYVFIVKQEETEKECSSCKKVKLIDEFPLRERGRRRADCRKCHNEWVKRNRSRSEVKRCRAEYYQKYKKQISIRKASWATRNRFILALQRIARFSIKNGYAPCIATEEEIIELFTGICHACGVPEQECNVKLCLDHDHSTGQARGWLCADCNKALGFLRNSTERALLLAEYAEKHSQHQREKNVN